MVAQTVTSRVSPALVMRLANLQREIAGSANIDITDNTTSTVTLVHTTSTGAITVDYSST